MKRVCIFAPHQDDEILACTYLIKQALREGNEITVVFLTTGDFKGRASAKIRMFESIAALERLGVSKEHIIQFGYANTGMKIRKCLLYQFYKRPQKEKRVHTPYSSETYHPDAGETFHFTLYQKEAPYTAENFQMDIKNFLKNFQPDILYATSGFDKHGDHRASFFMIRDALTDLKKKYAYEPEFYTFLIHTTGVWPNRKGARFRRPLFMKKEHWEQRVAIFGQADDIELKRLLIQYYKSQKECMRFLLSFAKKEEIFWRQNY